MPFTFRRPTLDDAQMILDWRTRPEITRYMLTDIEYDIEKQCRWLKACESRLDFEHFLVLREGKPIGYLSYSNIDRVNRHCVPGTYLVLEPQERHLAAHTNSFILDYCFYRLDMNKALFTIMAGNDHFLKAKHLTGVRHVGVWTQHIWKYGAFHDLHMFELTRAEWDATRRLFSRETTFAAFPSEGKSCGT
jgi:RimJ/RimL family protein N-acetyltransferase